MSTQSPTIITDTIIPPFITIISYFCIVISTYFCIHGTVILISGIALTIQQYLQRTIFLIVWLYPDLIIQQTLNNLAAYIMTSKCETNIEYDDVTQEDQERFMKEALLMVIFFSLHHFQWPFVDWFSNIGRESSGSRRNSSRMCPCTTRQDNRIRDEWYKSVYECMSHTNPDPQISRSFPLITETRLGHKTCRIPRNRGSASDIPKVNF